MLAALSQWKVPLCVPIVTERALMLRLRVGGINAAVVRGKTALARRRMHHTADGDGGCSCLSDAKPWIQRLSARRWR